MKKKQKIHTTFQMGSTGNINQYKETPALRKKRISEQKGLYIRVVENKKAYNRKRKKRELYGKAREEL